MNSLKSLLISAALLASSTFVMAGEKTVILDVNNMTCMSCPYQVKSALNSVDGVIEASASLEANQAIVMYDDAVTNIAALIEATTNVGFPSAQATSAVN
jgi:mercuric ion binding protein